MKIATLTVPVGHSSHVVKRGYPLNVRLPSGHILNLFLQDAHKKNKADMVLVEYTTGMIFSRGLYGAFKQVESEPNALKLAVQNCVIYDLFHYGEDRIKMVIAKAPVLNEVPDFPVETMEV